MKIICSILAALSLAISTSQISLAEQKIFWTDSSQGSILRASLDGTNLETIVTGIPDQFQAGPIAIDDLNQKLYYFETIGNDIISINLDGTSSTVHVSDVANGRFFTLDHLTSTLYWTDPDYQICQYNATSGALCASLQADGIAVSPASTLAFYGSFANPIRKVVTSGANGVFSTPSSFANDSGVSALKFLPSANKLAWFSVQSKIIRSKSANAAFTDASEDLINLSSLTNTPKYLESNRQESVFFWGDSEGSGIRRRGKINFGCSASDYCFVRG